MLTSFGPNAYFFSEKSRHFSGRTPAFRLQKSGFPGRKVPFSAFLTSGCCLKAEGIVMKSANILSY
ncbi:hypothetical protein FDF36_01230 [Bacteroides fragilis]|nr:hypothetical protein [Bacteroides fragilis]